MLWLFFQWITAWFRNSRPLNVKERKASIRSASLRSRGSSVSADLPSARPTTISRLDCKLQDSVIPPEHLSLCYTFGPGIKAGQAKVLAPVAHLESPLSEVKPHNGDNFPQSSFRTFIFSQRRREAFPSDLCDVQHNFLFFPILVLISRLRHESEQRFKSSTRLNTVLTSLWAGRN